jgi:peroxiredoxin
MPKISVDMPAPEFKIADYLGKEFTPQVFLGKKNVVLVFNRGFM